MSGSTISMQRLASVLTDQVRDGSQAIAQTCVQIKEHDDQSMLNTVWLASSAVP